MVNLSIILFKKTLRDLKNLLGPALTLSCILAAGLSSLIMSQSNLKSLLASQRLTYQKLNFSDAVIPLTRFPRHLIQSISKTPGIQRVDCRLSVSGQVRLPKEKKQISARFHSLPEHDSLNTIKIMMGRWPRPHVFQEALLTDAFASAWKIRPGDTLDVQIKGHHLKFTVTGLVRSPEYIYQAGSAASIPDDKLFSAWWINRRVIEETSDLQSSCNELLISISHQKSITSIEGELASKLTAFGFTQILLRKRLLSHYFLESELSQLKGMSIFMPGLFLLIAVFVLNITMTRVLLTQRESIGALRAFGFERPLIATQCLAFSLAILLPGLIVGIASGLWMSQKMFNLYTQFYRFAFTIYQFDSHAITLSFALYVTTSVSGCVWGLLPLMHESPAETLSPAIPKHTRATLLDNLAVFKMFSLNLRMSFRNLFRRPWHSLVTFSGLILSTTLLIFARFEAHAVQNMIDSEFIINQRQSHVFAFDRRIPLPSAHALFTRLKASLSESSLTLPITLSINHESRELSLIVKPDGETLRNAEIIPLRSRSLIGVSLSKSLAEALHLRLPCEVMLTTHEAKPQRFEVTVTNFSENMMGTMAIISESHFTHLTRSEKSFNTVLSKIEKGREFDEKRIFSEQPHLVSLSEKNFEKKAFEKTMAENIALFKNVMIGFALLIAFGVLYNNARVQFAEREREFALLRALGFYEAELTVLFWTDFLILTLLALAPGLWLGRKLLVLMMRSLETEIFRIPVDIPIQSYVWSGSVMLLAVFFIAILMQPKIHRIAFLSILKIRE